MADTDQQRKETVDAVIVGAGFAGMYMMYRLRNLGLSMRCFDVAGDVGGTWYWNRYPGARCDVESLNYSYSFDEDLQQEWSWTERFAGQPEILAYASHVADRFDLRRDVSFSTRVTSATFDDASETWQVRTDRGHAVTARWLVMATGNLSMPRRPDFEGLDDFAGRWFHTGQWPHEPVSFGGRRVGVIGTGASGIQVIPVVAQEAAHLSVFQRTPSFSMPARNGPMDEAHERSIKSRYRDYRRDALTTTSGVVRDKIVANSPQDLPEAERRAAMERYWQKGGTDMLKAFADLGVNKASNDIVADFIREKIRAKVDDPETGALLSAQTDPVGTRRVSLDTHYFETFNRDNVTLVDVKSDPIRRIVPEGIETESGTHELDDLIFATGYDAITGALLDLDIRGRGGRRLHDDWADGPRTYLGLMTESYPNMFIVTGPGSPSVLTNMIVSIEQHVEFIADLIDHAEQSEAPVIEALPEAQTDWVAEVNQIASRTLHVTANSWYRGVNVPGKPQIFMPYVGGFARYRETCEAIRADGFRGFTFSKAAKPLETAL